MKMKSWVAVFTIFSVFIITGSWASAAGTSSGGPDGLIWQSGGHNRSTTSWMVAQADTETEPQAGTETEPQPKPAAAPSPPDLKYSRDFFPVDPPDIKRIKDRGKIICAQYHSDVPPFYFHDEAGNYTGIDVHLVKGFARLLGVDVEWHRESKSFNDVIRAVANREADIACSKLGLTFWRAERIRYTDAYIMLHQGLLINRLELQKQRKGRPREVTIQNLEGYLGAIEKSSYVDNAKERFKKAKVKEGLKNWDMVLEAVAKGEVVAAYRDEVEIKQIIRDKPDFALRFLTVVLKDAKDPKAMVVAWDDVHLHYLLNYYISYLDLELTANKVLDEYEDVIKEIEKKTKVK